MNIVLKRDALDTVNSLHSRLPGFDSRCSLGVLEDLSHKNRFNSNLLSVDLLKRHFSCKKKINTLNLEIYQLLVPITNKC